MDDYNDASRLVEGNFDDPRLTDYDTLLANVADLKRGEATQAPIYDFKQSRRVGYREVAVPEARIVIIEGIYALSSRIRPLLDLRVSVTGGVHFDLVKRVLRDITRSGQEPEAIIQQISDTVYPMYKAYIEPDLKSAHLRIYNTFNPFTGFMDATYILKSDVAVADEQVLAVLGPHYYSSPVSKWERGVAGIGMGCESGAATPTTMSGAVAAAAAASPISTPARAFSTPQSALGVSNTPAVAAAAPASTTSVSSPPPTTTTTAVAAAAAAVPPLSAAASPRSITRDESETYDIYLLPPNEDPETCSSWLRMRNRDGRYSLMFEEWVVDGPFIISPRITFEVGVRVLGGLMALGYEIGTIMRRTSRAFSNGHLTVKFDDIEGMGRTFVQVQGKDRAAVAAAGAVLGLEGSYSPRSYIEMVQLEKLTESFRTVTDDLRRRFAVGGEPLFDAEGLGTPPSSGGAGSFGKNGKAFGFGGGGVGTGGGGRGRGRGGRGGGGAKKQEAPSFTRTTGFNPTPSAAQQQQGRPLTLTQSAPTNGSSVLLARLQRDGGGGAGSSDDDDDDERRGGDNSSCTSSSDDDDDDNGASPHRKHFSAAKAAAKRAFVEAERQEELKLQRREAARRSTGSGAGGGMGPGAGSGGTSRSSSDPGNAAVTEADGGSRAQHQQQLQLQSAALRLATGTPVPPSAGAAAAAAVSAAAAAAAHNNYNSNNEGRMSPLSQRSDASLDTVAAAAVALDGRVLQQQLLNGSNDINNGRRHHLGSISGGDSGLPLLLASPGSYPATTDAQAVLADAMARLATAVDSVDRRSAARVAWASGALGAAVGAVVALVLAKAMR